MKSPGDATVEPLRGDFHGRPTLSLANGALRVEVLAEAGPRIVGLRRVGGVANLLAETPDLGWDTAAGRYELVGGHRLWLAPEDPERVAVPDSQGLTVEALDDGLRLTGALEHATGCVRSIDVQLDPSEPSLSVLHRVVNNGTRAIALALWSITQLPLGGLALIPQRHAAAGHATRPNRNLVLWPYSSWDDARLRMRDGLVTVDATAGPDLKVGSIDDTGWVAYARDGTAIVRRFTPQTADLHPDLGCNVEVYCGSRFLELEVLGPMRDLAPGASATLLERWEVHDVSDLPAGDAIALRDRIGNLAPEPPAATPPDPRAAAGTGDRSRPLLRRRSRRPLTRGATA
ncbi:MAG TPA: hypothetical protein VGK16_14835 [Candidatus Limnocylindrales bacterium]|jgi:hypothetical protein